VVTYSVGGLSALNAVAGAYAEDLPGMVISGSPNTNSTAKWELLHHTLGKVDYGYHRRIFENVTVAASVIHHPLEAPRQNRSGSGYGSERAQAGVSRDRLQHRRRGDVGAAGSRIGQRAIAKPWRTR